MATTVLVVEDDLEINELIGEYLALENIQYLQAAAGGAGLELAKAKHPDAIILDLMLPDVDGFEVARDLTTHRGTYDIPIIILSCMCQDCDREKGFHAGALFYMNKPFLPDDLLATLRQALDWKASLKTRTAAGAMALSNGEVIGCNKGLHQMTADLFARTDLPETVVGQMREAMDVLRQWSKAWAVEHPAAPSQVTVSYRITPAGGAKTKAGIEWTLSEDRPGLLNDAFFKSGATGTAAGGGLIGWGASTLLSRPVTPVPVPSRWLQILTQTGSPRFEKDSRLHTVKFARGSGELGPVNGSGVGGGVPVVELEGGAVRRAQAVGKGK